MSATVHFVLDGQPVRLAFQPGTFPRPTSTLLQYLRSLPDHRGVKEGCAEGDCGACTVVVAELRRDNALHYKAVDSCLVFLPMLHGKQVITVENLRDASGSLHPVQQAMVEHNGSQCGFCTPGVVMSLFALYKSTPAPAREGVVDAVAGNLCRCTGYRSIIDAGLAACGSGVHDRFSTEEEATRALLTAFPLDDLELDTGEQRYMRPRTLARALEVRRENPSAVIICGATDVALRVTKGHEQIRCILDLSAVEELRAIEEHEGGTLFGAAITMQELLETSRARFPSLAGMLEGFGSRQIRNVATIGGNIGTASPIGDTLPVLMALRAEVLVTGPSGTRRLPIEQMIVGYRTTACGPHELITGVFVPVQSPGTIVRSYKISRRRDLDISTVSGAFRLRLSADGRIADVLLAYGGMAAKVQRAMRAEASLEGKLWTRQAVEEAMDVLEQEFTPLNDVRGSAGFRSLIAKNLLLRFWDDTSAVTETVTVEG